jgi:hypothetical protein
MGTWASKGESKTSEGSSKGKTSKLRRKKKHCGQCDKCKKREQNLASSTNEPAVGLKSTPALTRRDLMTQELANKPSQAGPHSFGVVVRADNPTGNAPPTPFIPVIAAQPTANAGGVVRKPRGLANNTTSSRSKKVTKKTVLDNNDIGGAGGPSVDVLPSVNAPVPPTTSIQTAVSTTIRDQHLVPPDKLTPEDIPNVAPTPNQFLREAAASANINRSFSQQPYVQQYIQHMNDGSGTQMKPFINVIPTDQTAGDFTGGVGSAVMTSSFPVRTHTSNRKQNVPQTNNDLLQFEQLPAFDHPTVQLSGL